MCLDPILAAAVGAQVVGTFMQNKAAKKVTSERNAVLDAENARQEQFRQQGAQTFADSLGYYQKDPKQTTQTAGEDRAAFIRENAAAPAIATPTRGSAPAIVAEERNRTSDNASRDAGSFADALGLLGGHDAAMFDRRVGLGRNALDLGQNANLAAGSAGVVPLELEAANRAGDRLNGFADLFNGAGQLGMAYSLFGTGPKPTWGSLFGPPASASFRGAPLTAHP